MWKIAASAAGRLTVGIQGTSLSMTSTTSASASASFCRGSFHWLPWWSGWSAGKFIAAGTDSSTPAPSASAKRTSSRTARGRRPR